MKNRNIQFKPTAGVLIPLLLACLAAVFISAPTPAAASEIVPFNATLSGYVETQEPAGVRALSTDTRSFSETRPNWEPYTGTGEFRTLPTIRIFAK